MDPVSGLSLAASLITVTECGVNIASKCRKLYVKGGLPENVDMEKQTKHFEKLVRNLQMASEDSSANAVLSEEETDLKSLSADCEKTAGDLLSELHKLGFAAGEKRTGVKAMSRALKATWKKETIAGLQSRLDSYRKVLELSLMHRLSQKFDVQALQQRGALESLSDDFRAAITALEKSERSVASTEAGNASQSEIIQDVHHGQLEDKDHENAIQTFHDGLFFPHMFARQRQITESYKDTYDWVFEDAIFKTWLERGHGIFHWTGKPGAGKSTLMKYLASHDTTKELLCSWAAPNPVSTASYFFWELGNPRQKDAVGMLQSLTYQLLSIDINYGKRSIPKKEAKNPPHSWTLSTITATLLQIAKAALPRRLCFFIDGLDECIDQYRDLTNLIKSFLSQRNIKVVVSSRPLDVFLRELGDYPQLRLQDLTRGSIKKFVRGKLAESDSLGHLRSAEVNRALRMTDQVVAGAEGVFLWASVVTNIILNGLDAGDTLSEIETEISFLPSEMQDLYLTILHRRIRPSHYSNTAYYLRIVLECQESLDICTFSLIEEQSGNNDTAFQYRKPPLVDLEADCKRMRARISSRTAGLLEFSTLGSPTMIPPSFSRSSTNDAEAGSHSMETQYPSSILQLFFDTRVELVHRTVKEFFLENSSGVDFMRAHAPPRLNVHRSLAKGLLARMLFGSSFDRAPKFTNTIAWDMEQVFKYIAVAEKMDKRPQKNLIESIRYEDFASPYRIPEVPHDSNHIPLCRPWWFNRFANHIDLIGLAAHLDMAFYVCWKMGLPEPLMLHDLGAIKVTHASIAYARNHSCKISDHVEAVQVMAKISPEPDYVSEPFRGGVDATSADDSREDYRTKMLSWFQVDFKERSHSRKSQDKLVESYLLFCACSETIEHGLGEIELLPFQSIHALLDGGADPNLNFVVQDCVDPDPSQSSSGSSWKCWIGHVDQSRIPLGMRHMSASRTIPLRSYFNSLKAFLNRGVRIQEHPTGTYKDRTVTRRGENVIRCRKNDLLVLCEVLRDIAGFEEVLSILRDFGHRALLQFAYIYDITGSRDKAWLNAEDARTFLPLLQRARRTKSSCDIAEYQKAAQMYSEQRQANLNSWKMKQETNPWIMEEPNSRKTTMDILP